GLRYLNMGIAAERQNRRGAACLTKVDVPRLPLPKHVERFRARLRRGGFERIKQKLLPAGIFQLDQRLRGSGAPGGFRRGVAENSPQLANRPIVSRLKRPVMLLVNPVAVADRFQSK